MEPSEHKREYFRIDTVVPLSLKKVTGDARIRQPKILAGHITRSFESVCPDVSVSAALWELLLEVNSKLNLVLDKLTLKNEATLDLEERFVNISGTGMRLTVTEKFEVGDVLEIKMALEPDVVFLIYGTIVRVDENADGTGDVALCFSEITDEIRDRIIHNLLNRQREIFRDQKQKKQP